MLCGRGKMLEQPLVPLGPGFSLHDPEFLTKVFSYQGVTVKTLRGVFTSWGHQTDGAELFD